jgi:hypothetical protein
MGAIGAWAVGAAVVVVLGFLGYLLADGPVGVPNLLELAVGPAVVGLGSPAPFERISPCMFCRRGKLRMLGA